MDPRFANILNALDIEDKTIKEFQKRTSATTSDHNARILIDELKIRADLCRDTGDMLELAHHNLFLSHCCQIILKSEEAKRYATMAIEHFRVCGLSWNQAMAHWYLGLIHKQEGSGYRFRDEIKRALEIVDPICEEHLIVGRYEENQACKLILESIQKDQDVASKMGTGPLHNHRALTGNGAVPPSYLTIPWLPEYRRVRAGPQGIIWEDPPEDSNTIVHNIQIGSQFFRLHSIKKTAATDVQITLNHGREYGWARVEGHSMNDCWPVSIEHGDYVLFFKNQRAVDDEIVIASCKDTNDTFAFMVKRYKEMERALFSETNDKSQPYEPVTLTEDSQIVGIVVAVAKLDG
jgi:hypothetical protein